MTDINVFKVEGKPLEKLFDVISNCFGVLYKPRSIRKEADATAYAIEVTTRAKAKALAESKVIEFDTIEIIQDRLIQKEIKKQINREQVCEIAIEQMSSESTVSDEPVDNDWTTRFFNIVEDISDKEMQNLWGQILAGEVKQPKSFSLRTLELLRNLSKDEANLFIKFAQIAITGNIKDYFIFNPDNGIFLKNTFGITLMDILFLTEIGLLKAETELGIESESPAKDEKIALMYGKKAFFIDRKVGTPKQTIEGLYFTKSGIEILKLVTPIYIEAYILRIAQVYKCNTTIIKFGDYISNGNGSYKIENARLL